MRAAVLYENNVIKAEQIDEATCGKIKFVSK